MQLGVMADRRSAPPAWQYHKSAFVQTIAPSMDICVSSNFERFLFWLGGNDCATLAGWMEGFKRTGKLTLDGELLEKAQVHRARAARGWCVYVCVCVSVCVCVPTRMLSSA